ncbi:MAG TPA: PIN domain-containing protein [Solirubrobacterales bacterium]|nr:PIN domain-containing protein [Solirubrobacterales bacterium]
MTGVYLDTSAVGRVLLGEPDSQAVLAALSRFDQHVASRLLRIELRRLALRHDLLDHADQLLSAIALVPMDEATLEAAETVPPNGVATLDAIHLATALRLAADGLIDAVLTHDTRLAEGARHHGLEVLAPSP